MKKIQFVCIGNCCRSQMAEGFANHYGTDVLRATSSGISPTEIVAQETIDTMREKNIDISQHYPKLFDPFEAKAMDLIVNMSGCTLPGKSVGDIEEWEVTDPYGGSMKLYSSVANTIEMRVMSLILRLRRFADH